MKKRAPDPDLPFPPSRRFTPAILAKAAIARKPTTPSGHRVEFALTLFLRREIAEAFVAQALREDKNVPAFITDLLEAEIRRRS